MNILLDTNIIIPLEDTSRILDTSFAELRKLSAEQSHCLYIHPMQLEDINRARIKERLGNRIISVKAIFKDRKSTNLIRSRML